MTVQRKTRSRKSHAVPASEAQTPVAKPCSRRSGGSQRNRRTQARLKQKSNEEEVCKRKWELRGQENYASAEEDGGSTLAPKDLEEERQAKTRARNRRSAAKARMRKKHGIDCLQETEARARELHTLLRHQVSTLRSETLMLENMLLNHAGSGCTELDSFVRRRANNMVGDVAASSSQEAGSPQA